jgi:hypothetical protein
LPRATYPRSYEQGFTVSKKTGNFLKQQATGDKQQVHSKLLKDAIHPSASARGILARLIKQLQRT